MKKIITTTAAAVILSAAAINTYAMEAEITPYVFEEQQWIEISGTSDKEFQNIAIKVLKADKENSENVNDAILITTVTSDANKEFEKSFRVPSDLEGVCVFKFMDDSGKPMRKEFNIISLEITLQKFETICTSEIVADIKTALGTHAHAIGIDTTTYDTLSDPSKNAAISMFIKNRKATEKTEFTVDDISSLLKDASIIAHIKSSSGTAASVMEQYDEYLELKKDEIYIKYAEDISSSMFSAICERVVKCADEYTSFGEIKATFKRQVLFELIQNGATWYTTQKVVDENYELMGLTSADISKASSLSQPSLVYQKLTGAMVYTKEEFKSAFDTAYSNSIRPNPPSGGNNYTGSSSGGSSGGGGGGGNIMRPTAPSVSTPDDTTNNKPEEISGFSDVKEYTPWAQDAVNELVKRKVVNGKSKDSFAPNDHVTREEFAKMIVLAIGFSTSDGKGTGFDDVDESMWYAAYVKAAKDNGIINGKSDAIFGIGQNITRQDMAVMIYRATGGEKPTTDMPFADSNNVSDYAKDAVSYMSEKGIINGQSDNMFAPKSFATRAEAAVMLSNMIKFNGIQ